MPAGVLVALDLLRVFLVRGSQPAIVQPVLDRVLQLAAGALGERHERRLREVLLSSEAPPRTEYPLFGNVFLDPGTRQLVRMLMPPVFNRLGELRVYTFLYGGCSWHFVVASHSTVDSRNPFLLSESGELGMAVFDIMQLRKVDFAKLIRLRLEGTYQLPS